MKLFIDCGTSLFQGITIFNEIYKFNPIEWDLILVEANPFTYNESKDLLPLWLKHQNINHVNKAVTISGDFVDFNCAAPSKKYLNRLNFLNSIFLFLKKILGRKEKFTSKSSNLSIDKHLISNEIIFEYQTVKVQVFNLSKFLNNHSQNYEQIIVKLDIEGAEFDVIQDLIDTKAHLKINKIYVEFHEQYFKDHANKLRLKELFIDEFRRNKIEIEDWI